MFKHQGCKSGPCRTTPSPTYLEGYHAFFRPSLACENLPLACSGPSFPEDDERKHKAALLQRATNYASLCLTSVFTRGFSSHRQRPLCSSSIHRTILAAFRETRYCVCDTTTPTFLLRQAHQPTIRPALQLLTRMLCLRLLSTQSPIFQQWVSLTRF